MAKTPKNKHQDPETTGHEWDGIEEFNNPLPRWWLWTFYITIIWGVGYTIAYPAWPGLVDATPGLLNYSTRAEVAKEITRFDEANAENMKALAEVDLTQLAENPEIADYAAKAGASVFLTYCAQCHGSGAAGAKGYPNLLDNAWLWGGDIEAIHTTIAHGIRNDVDPDARYSEMPAFGEILTEEEIAAAANYVLSLSGEPDDPSLVEAGETVYMDNCAVCHMEDGSGDITQGAPNIADAIWLFGGDYDTVVETITYSRFGVMPPWSNRLTEAEVNAVAAYVHQLGGGQ